MMKTINKKKAAIYIIAGQSNAVGACPHSDVSILEGSLNQVNIMDLSDSNFFKMELINKTRGSRVGQSFGPELGLALTYLHENRLTQDGELFIIKHARGGSGFSNPRQNWNPDGPDGNLYHGLMDKINIAHNLLHDQGYEVSFKSFLWVQCGADARRATDDPSIFDLYEDKLGELMTDVRNQADFYNNNNEFELVTSLCHLNKEHSYQKNAASFIRIRDIQEQVTNNLGGRSIDTNDLSLFPLSDSMHFNGEALLNLGAQYLNPQYISHPFNTDGSPYVNTGE